MIRVVLAVALSLFTLAPALAQQSVPALREPLKGGGYVIVLRHGATPPDQADTDPLHPENVAQQRQLTEKGRAEAKALGDTLKQAGIPLGKVYSSKFNRAIETARLISGKEPETTLDVTIGQLVITGNETRRRAEALRTMAATPPAAGTNTLIVTHYPNILDAFGKNWFEVREAEASIFKPDGAGRYTPVAQVQIGQWPDALR
jgi:phosphohistidine phosphatase SixA